MTISSSTDILYKPVVTISSSTVILYIPVAVDLTVTGAATGAGTGAGAEPSL